ncbi:MAG: hypothetical protein ABI995_11630, partial [Acidobacteriota bacterium]
MKYWALSTCALALLTGSYAVKPVAMPVTRQRITAAPSGPFHVAGNQILDAQGRSFLMRGTQLTDFHWKTALADRASADNYFGPHSATSLTAIRLRF